MMAKIFIDPGHGGQDPGAVGKYLKEKDNVLKVGLRLKELLEAAGHTVKMSRTTDVYVSLSTRAQMANEWGADYFISGHDNSATSTASGFETFVFSGAVSSKTLGFQKAIHDAIVSNIGIRDRGRKRANFAVIRETKMPAVLIEYAFISNKDDEQILLHKVEQLAQWTANGVTAYAGGKVDQVSKPVSKPQPTKPAPKPVSKPKPSKSTANLTVDGYMGVQTIKALQRYFGTPVDGVISRPSTVIKALQKLLDVKSDGYMGPITIRAMQKRFDTPVDGKISRPSTVIKALQKRLNKGKL